MDEIKDIVEAVMFLESSGIMTGENSARRRRAVLMARKTFYQPTAEEMAVLMGAIFVFTNAFS